VSTIVKNVGAMINERNTRGNDKTQGDQGTVRLEYEKVQYVFGPNESKSLEDGIAAALVGLDSRLRVATSQDGIANASGKGVS
jgi:hypothetical protein